MIKSIFGWLRRNKAVAIAGALLTVASCWVLFQFHEAIFKWLGANKDPLAIMGALIAAFGTAWWALVQYREAAVWKKTDLARQILEEIWADERCAQAMLMVDWTNRAFEIAPGITTRITEQEVRAALRVEALEFSTKEIFIRDCFDSLLDALQRIEHYIERDLILVEDVAYPLEYTVTELRRFRGEIERYVNAYNFHYAKEFLRKHRAWKSETDLRPACIAADEPLPAVSDRKAA